MYSSSSTTKELSISLFMCFRHFNFGQTKMIFCGDENLKNCFIANVNVYRYSNLIPTDNYFRTNCCLIINLNKTVLKLNKIPYDIYYEVFSNIYISEVLKFVMYVTYRHISFKI